jgi:hypothetical protein
MINASTGNVILLGGNGNAGWNSDAGLVTNAEFNLVMSVAFDPAGNLHIAVGNYVAFKVNQNSRIVSTAVGTGVSQFSGDNGPATKCIAEHPDIYRI